MPTEIEITVDNIIEVKRPSMYSVILHNDDYTPMDFVVQILVGIFDKDQNEATALMLEVHQKGKSIVGEYVYDIAMTKKLQADAISDQSNYPLKITVEEAGI